MPPRPPPNPSRPSLPIAQKVAVRFAKTGPARWHSHHDLMRFWERAVRRAGLPVRLTEGFNPKPRLVFPHALGVGVSSDDEWVEMEFVGARSPEEIRRRLEEALRPVLTVMSVRECPPTRKGRVVSACVYRIECPAAAGGGGAAWREAVGAMLALPKLEVERGPERERTTVDARPYLRGAEYLSPGVVRITLAHTPRGAGRVDEWARWLGATLSLDPRRFSLVKESTMF